MDIQYKMSFYWLLTLINKVNFLVNEAANTECIQREKLLNIITILDANTKNFIIKVGISP